MRVAHASPTHRRTGEVAWASSIQFDDAARDALRRGVEQLANAVRVTLGPAAATSSSIAARGTPTITDDGLAIAREIELENPFENMGVQLLREVAIKTGEAAGDGTTTATVLAEQRGRPRAGGDRVRPQPDRREARHRSRGERRRRGPAPPVARREHARRLIARRRA